MSHELIKELKALLKKHKAVISFSVGDSSDTYGLHDEKLVISVKELKEGNRYPKTVPVFEVEGWHMDETDL